MNLATTIKCLIAGAVVGTCIAAVTGCGDSGDTDTVTDTHTLRLSDDGLSIICDHGEEEEIEKSLLKVPTKTGESPVGVFTDRYIPDSWNVRWAFAASCNIYPEYKEMARWGIQDMFQQGWTFSALVPLQTWTQQEVTTGGVDVVITCEPSTACSRAGTCSALGSGGMNGTRHLAGTVNGINYYQVESGVIRANVEMMTNWVHNMPGYTSGYDENWVRANTFYFLTQHEMIHNLGGRHRNTTPTTPKYLNDANVPIPGVGGYSGTPNNTDSVSLSPCMYQRLRRVWTEKGTGWTQQLELSAIPSECPGDDKF
jgi:hypothetical protein